jgi:hypothetical protein
VFQTTDTEIILGSYIIYNNLTLFENRVLERIFEARTDEMEGGWRKLHNEELHKL